MPSFAVRPALGNHNWHVDPDATSTTPDCDINAVGIDRTILFTHVTVRGRSLEIRTIESTTGNERDRVTIAKTR